MVEWNPVKGLKEIARGDIQAGDVIIQYLDRSYTDYTVSKGMTFSEHGVYYLLNRELVKEPEGRGDVAEIYLKTEGREDSVYFFIRTRPKSSGDPSRYNPPWTDEGNDCFKTWDEILDLVDDNSMYALRTHKASYSIN